MFTPQEAQKYVAASRNLPQLHQQIDTALRAHAVLGFATRCEVRVGSDRVLAEALYAEYEKAGWKIEMVDVGPDRAHQSYEDWLLKFSAPKTTEGR